MLLCLDREQRLIYILGEIFEVTDGVGSELLDISRDNFRQKLARARRDLHNFMNERCGLVNRANPCRCANKTRGFMQAGYVDPNSLLFARDHTDVFRQHPFHPPHDLVPALRRLLAGPSFKQATGSL